MEAKAILEGHLSKVDPNAYRRGDLMNHEYAIRASPIASCIWETQARRRKKFTGGIISSGIGGEDLNKELNDILRIPARGV